MALNSVKLLLVAETHAEETLPCPVADLDRAVLVLAHEAVAAALKLGNLGGGNRHSINFLCFFQTLLQNL